jgi:tellurite methyltransferase
MKSKKDTWDNHWESDEDHSWWKKPAPEVIDFIASQTPQERPKVLDLGCGFGRHSIAFAQAGFSVTAVDVSEAAVSHLNNWASGLSLEINTLVCIVSSDQLPRDNFDIILAYNVIYHGYRHEFTAAVEHVGRLLKTGGLFYFTCPTRADGKYGIGTQVAPHTYMCKKSMIPGDIHYFADETDLDELLTAFSLVEKSKREGYWDNKGTRQFYSNWCVLAQKS